MSHWTGKNSASKQWPDVACKIRDGSRIKARCECFQTWAKPTHCIQVSSMRNINQGSSFSKMRWSLLTSPFFQNSSHCHLWLVARPKLLTSTFRKVLLRKTEYDNMIEIPQDDCITHQNSLSSHYVTYFYWAAFCRHITLWKLLMGLSSTNGTETVGGI